MPKSRSNSSRRGHASHTQDAGSSGFDGALSRPIKVVVLGAGSSFTPRLVNDIVLIPGHRGGEFALVDLDMRRLGTMQRVIRKLVGRSRGKSEWKVTASKDRRSVLRGADYVINCIEVSGTACVRLDNEIPQRYGIDQCIGDTMGPGGLFKGLRTIPVWIDVLRDIERLCPGALVLNYTNPMGMMCAASALASDMSVVGLCHSVQGTGHILARRAGIPYEEMEWECAGINHLAWFTVLRHRGRDLYPLLMKKARADLAGRSDDTKDLVRKDMMLHFGAFITESSGHLSEYLPYYRKRSDLLAKYCREGYDGGSGFYAANWPEWRKRADAERLRMLRGLEPLGWNRSWEYASWIIEAREKNAATRIHGNVMNSKGGSGLLITNLPAGGCVEVACLVDGSGVHPVRYGALPAQMAAVCASNMGFIQLAAQAAFARSKEAAIHALMLDPLTAAVLSPAEIKRMALEIFAAEKAYLPGYR